MRTHHHHTKQGSRVAVTLATPVNPDLRNTPGSTNVPTRTAKAEPRHKRTSTVGVTSEQFSEGKTSSMVSVKRLGASLITVLLAFELGCD